MNPSRIAENNDFKFLVFLPILLDPMTFIHFEGYNPFSLFHFKLVSWMRSDSANIQ